MFFLSSLLHSFPLSFEDNNRPFPSALEALSNEADLKATISQSRTFAHDQIFSFHQVPRMQCTVVQC